MGVTGNALPSDVEHFKAMGADDVLLKPMDVAKFGAILERRAIAGPVVVPPPAADPDPASTRVGAPTAPTAAHEVVPAQAPEPVAVLLVKTPRESESDPAADPSRLTARDQSIRAAESTATNQQRYLKRQK